MSTEKLRYSLMLLGAVAVGLSLYWIFASERTTDVENVYMSAPGVESAAEQASSPDGDKSLNGDPSPMATEASEQALSELAVVAETLPNDSEAVPLNAIPVSVRDAVYRGNHSKRAAVSIPVLNYHGVTVQPGNIAVITPQKLDEQMKYLSEHGYTTLSLQQFIDIWEGRTVPPAKSVLLTFDDGYMDNYTAAMPILQKYGFKATLFMSPGKVDDGYYLNWDQVKEMHRAGWDIQPHGMTHPHLPRLSAEKQAYEIVESRRQIEEQLGIKADVFCYPYGERNETTLKILKEHGFRYAFTIEQGRSEPQQHPYQIRRLFVNGEKDLKSFKALLE